MGSQKTIYHYAVCFEVGDFYYEDQYMTFGKPIKTLAEIEKETADEYMIAIAEGQECEINELFAQKLEDNGYYKVKYEETFSPELHYFTKEYVEELLNADEGDDCYGDKYHQRLQHLGLIKKKDTTSSSPTEPVFTPNSVLDSGVMEDFSKLLEDTETKE